ncbi:F510_1955 family glycosylhydrolase [Thiomonas sp.]
MKHFPTLRLAAALLTVAATTLPAWAAGPAMPAVAGIAAAGAPVELMHVHGLAFSPDGTRLYIPDHNGVAVYSAGRWSTLPGAPNDYMGFTATRTAFYSSGHPAPGTNVVNPIGLVKSTDGGRTWHTLGLRGESDFHVMAAGYATNAVYAMAMGPNSRMPEPGLYGTLDDGFVWKQAAADGLEGEVFALAVHPTDPRIVAAATKSGLYLSTDAGAHFRAVAGNAQFLSVAFDLDGKHLWYGSYDGQPHLTRIAFAGGSGARQAVTLPPLREDAVAYVAQNPARHGELAIATFRRDVYLSLDGGRSWKQIAAAGRTW